MRVDTIMAAFGEALSLFVTGASAVWEIIGRSLQVSGAAVFLATFIGIPLGYALGVSRFVGRRALVLLVNTGMGLPPVVAGLVVYLSLSRSGPLGDLRLLFSQPAMVAAQVLIATPLVVGVTAAATASVPFGLRLQARSLGASRIQEAWLVLTEARRGVMAAVVAGFGGIISEVGAVMMVGGNIQGSTRVMTTAIVLETRKGNFSTAMALGLILIAIAAIVNVALTSLQHGGARYER
jgi:tungstate transport system permease protein